MSYEITAFCILPGKTAVVVPNPDEAAHYAEDGPVADSDEGFKVGHDSDACACSDCTEKREAEDARYRDADRARDEQIDREFEEAADRDNYEPPEPDLNADGPAESDHCMDEARRSK